MAEQTVLQVRDLLPNSVQMEQTVRDALCKDNRDIRSMRLAWWVIGSEATGAVKSVLDFDVFEVVARVWCKASELHELTDRSKHPTGERSVVYLGEHKFAREIYPILTITIGPHKCPPLRFTLVLAANIRSIALAICDGHITSVASGDGNVSAQLKYGDVDLTKLESRKMQFPAHIEFPAPGLQIV